MPSGSKRILFLIRNIGDYHAPRLLRLQQRALEAGDEFLVLEAADRSSFYAHPQTRAALLKPSLHFVALHGTSHRDIIQRIVREMRRYRPSVVFALGYSDAIALTGLATGKAIGARVFFLSDSKADDQPRRAASEAVKARILHCYNGALVAGERHKAYFASLGVNPATILTGYDVIDNAYFAQRAARFRAKASLVQALGIVPARYVLVVSRLVPRKRVDRALALYAASRLPASNVSLLLIGQGPEEEQLFQQARTLGIAEHVLHRREVPNSTMPLFYTFADALLLTSEYDQWGLCVSEAMACGTPALVTSRCGCAGEIVLHGENGFVWNGASPDDGARLLDQLALDAETRSHFSAAALHAIAQWDLDRFAQSAMRLVHGDDAQWRADAEGSRNPV